MNKYLNDVALCANLSCDTLSDTVFGKIQGYSVVITQYNGSTQLMVSFSVSKGGMVPNITELRMAVKEFKPVKSCTALKYKATYTIAGNRKKMLETLPETLSGLTSFMREHGFENCCQGCGEKKETEEYNVSGVPAILCDECFSAASASTEQRIYKEAEKHENILGGIVGALLGSLLGAAVIVLLGQLGYVAALSGIVIAICTLKGYELLGGKLSTAGVIVSCVVMALMTYVGYMFDWSITVAAYFEATVFEAFGAISELIELGYIESGSFYTNLFMLYAFVAVGAIPTIIGALKGKKRANITQKMSAQPKAE